MAEGEGSGPASAKSGTLEPEEQARADLYGLVSRFFYAPADARLLTAIGQGSPGEGEGGGFLGAWRVLQEACRSADPAVVREEYDGLFVGVGKAPVTPYLSAYAEPASPDRYVVRLREQLEAWKLTRRESVFEVEDHISGLSDIMRWLIEARRPIAEQRVFFESFVDTGVVRFLAAVQNAPGAAFYKAVGVFSQAFFEVEKMALEMDDAG